MYKYDSCSSVYTDCTLWDTRGAFTATHQIEARSVNDAGLAATSEIQVKGHLEKHEGRVNAVLVQL